MAASASDFVIAAANVPAALGCTNPQCSFLEHAVNSLDVTHEPMDVSGMDSHSYRRFFPSFLVCFPLCVVLSKGGARFAVTTCSGALSECDIMLFGDFTSTFVLLLLLETVLMFLSHLKHLKYLKHHEIRSVTVSSSSCGSAGGSVSEPGGTFS